MDFFSKNIRLRFIKSEFDKPHLGFSDEFDNAFSKTRKALKRKHPKQNIDRLPTDLNNITNSLDTAREFTSLLPAHTLKVYAQLLKCEDVTINKNGFFVLDKPQIYMVDVGCGAGSASIALLMFLSNYQKFRIINKLPIYPVSVYLLGIDPNSHAINIYDRFISKASEEISKLLINIVHGEIHGKLSENSNDVLNWFDLYGLKNSCIFAFGNIIRPYNTEYAKQVENQRSIKQKINLLNRSKFIGDPDIRTISSILERVTIDCLEIIIISSPTEQTNKYPANNWLKETVSFLNQINNQFKASHNIIQKNKN
jgi:hypothetical protein